jgi:nicotinamidase/pyrazinamidase
MGLYDSTTALIVVDVQNDFADPAGSLSVSGGPRVVDAANAQVAAARAAGGFIVYTQDWHPADTPHFAKDGGIWPVHCVADTWGAELAPGLDVAGPCVRKGSGGEDGYSGFTVRDPSTGRETPTELVDVLRSHAVVSVVVVGLATDYCVKETAADAVRLGFTTTVLRHAIRAVDVHAGDGERALSDLRALGVQVVD